MRVSRTVGRVAERAPGLRRVPVLKVLAAGEILLLTRDHVRKLTPAERRRVVALVRRGRGRPRQLTAAEREELHRLVLKAEPRLLAGQAVDLLSPIKLPRRLLYGRARDGATGAPAPG